MDTTPPTPDEGVLAVIDQPRDPYAALRSRDFRLLFIGRFIWQLGEQMVTIAVGWELYDRTGSALALGLVGLVQVLPVIALALPAGHIADRFNRKGISIITMVMLALCSLGLALLSATQGPLALFYLILFVIGISRAFGDPAMSAMLPMTVSPEHFQSAATWNSSSWQLAAMLGPALGGFLIGSVFKAEAPVYLLNLFGCSVFIIMLLLIRGRKIALSTEAMTVQSLMAGVHFIRNTPVIFGAVTLDMFAVLFGGAVALLPVYAKDVLHVGPEGLGWLRAAPSIGAMLMALTIATLPPFKQAGKTLLWAVLGFGIATIIFGISQSFYLSLAMLALLGALDNISVVIRSTLLLTRPPDEMRGRISAVNSVFISTSNELGGFESGLAASVLGPVGAVVSGGIGTILVVLAVMQYFPELRDLKKLL
ncbi:MAG TPA: MFS transporter [Phototrophicaceae bacterium]|nr:MFS transporter [Phototrophicaceae bacterium]